MHMSVIRNHAQTMLQSHHDQTTLLIITLRCVLQGFSSEASKDTDETLTTHTAMSWTRKQGIMEDHCHISTTPHPQATPSAPRAKSSPIVSHTVCAMND